jgi:ABC-type antimicrobial peptide transport system permease subunit
LLRAAVATLDPQLAVNVASLADNLEQWRAPSRIFSAMSVLLAIAAVVLACTGVFGMVAYAVSRRTREIGIRVALGAANGDVLRLILRQGLVPVAVGIALGVPAAAIVSGALANLLFGLSPHDPVSFVAVTALLAIAAFGACWVPARRALRIAPAATLRE